MTRGRYTYPTFKVEDNVHAWERQLAQAIPQIGPRFFSSNPRFRRLGEIAAPTLVDYMGIYEEGDWWVITIIKTGSPNGTPRYSLFPLTDDTFRVLGSPLVRIFLGSRDIAFGLETDSQFHGHRQWKLVDALAAPAFWVKLLFLFPLLEEKYEHWLHTYITVHESGIGTFNFHLKEDIQERVREIRGIAIKVTRSDDTLIKYGRAFQLVLPLALPSADTSALETSEAVIGWITYTGPQNTDLLVGTLKRL